MKPSYYPILLGILSGLLSGNFSSSLAAPPDEAGNTPADALDLGQLDATPVEQTFADSVGVADTDDYYRFDLQANSNFKLRLDGLSRDANVFLGDSTGAIVARSKSSGTTPEEISTSLNPGTYYILVRPNPGVTGNTNYNLALSAKFIVSTASVSNPRVPLRDPEFDFINYQVAWGDDQENLRVAPVDPETGDFLLNQTILIDQGLAPLDCTGTVPLGICNGPEWAYSQDGSQIVYTKVVSGQLFLARARKLASNLWEPSLLEDGLGQAPFGSRNPEDTKPLIKFTPPFTSGLEPAAWREIDDPTKTGIAAEGLPNRGGRWVEGQRSLILTAQIDGIYQVVKFDIDTNLLTQLTFSSTPKGNAYMWLAPEFNNELVFMATETNTTAPPLGDTIGIYRNINGTWTKIKSIRLPSTKSFLLSPEPFKFGSKSYISTLAVTAPAGIPNRLKGAEVWIAGIEPDFDFYRLVNQPSSAIALDDPEPFVSSSKAFMYYLDVTGGKGVVYRAETGLSP
jgi:hypothetical protein